jgi:type VII secretion integral membrane protein EccD
MNTTGLVRVTVAAPGRRIDLALPERSPLAEILPGLLQQAGEHLADGGVNAGGWALHRADGSTLDPERTLVAHRVLDGEILHLMPARTGWPELEYDDLVDAIAAGSARASSAWGPRHTRWAGLGTGVVALLLALIAVLRAGPPWPWPAWCALGVAALVLTVGIVLARALGDAAAGAVFGVSALPWAFVGGGLLFADGRAFSALGAPHLLAAGAALLLAAIVGLLGVVDGAAIFVAAATVGLLAMLGAWLSTTETLVGHEAAAIVAGAGLAFSPLLASLSIRLARVPMPVLPRGTADLLRDNPQPPRTAVYAAVLRADGLLTGMIVGLAAAVVPCQALLVRDGNTAALILVGVLTVGFLLRARLYPIFLQRIALLVAGGSGAFCLVAGPLMADHANLLTMSVPAVVAFGALCVLAGLWYSRHNPSPYLGRSAELFEVAVVLAIVPVVCAVLGLYGYLRGLGG